MNTISLHERERPVSLLTSVIANANRDPKKKREGYSLNDFYLYEPRENKDLPKSNNGAAYMALVGMRLLPSWALTFYSEFSTAQSGSPPPLLAFIGSDFILLAPVLKNGSYEGALIALESASDKVATATSPCGKTVTFILPTINAKIVAYEGASLRVYES